MGALCVWVELGAGCRIIGGHCFASPLLTHAGQGPELWGNQSVYVPFECVQAGVADEMVWSMPGVTLHIRLSDLTFNSQIRLHHHCHPPIVQISCQPCLKLPRLSNKVTPV